MKKDLADMKNDAAEKAKEKMKGLLDDLDKKMEKLKEGLG